jgi:peptidoglycan/LPS O-acetylase OafA/YrhL
VRSESPSVLLGAPVRSRAGGRRLAAVAAVVVLFAAALAVVVAVAPHTPDRHVHGLLVVVALTLLFILVTALLRVVRHEVRRTAASRRGRAARATPTGGGAVDTSGAGPGPPVDASAP